MNNSKKVHCEITGAETTIEHTIVLVKIDGIIALKNINNPIVDFENKIIRSNGNLTLNFYSEIVVPDDLKQKFGRMFSIIDDEDDIEQSTAVMSVEGQKIYSRHKLFPYMEYITNGFNLIKIPSTMFLAVIDSRTILQTKECENWNINYKGLHGKYRFKNIIEESREQFIPGVLMPGFNIAVSDTSDNSPNGNVYHYKTESKFNSINLCCNESAVSFCQKNNTIVYYNDFIYNGKLRVLTPYTVSINKNLQNSYLYRSLNF